MDLFKVKAVPSITVKFQQAFLDGLVIELAGPSHPQTLQAERERDDAMAAAGKNGLKGEVRKQITTRYLASRLISWNAKGGGTDIPLTLENAVMILDNPDLKTVKDELWAAIGDDEQNYKSN